MAPAFAPLSPKRLELLGYYVGFVYGTISTLGLFDHLVSRRPCPPQASAAQAARLGTQPA